MFSPPLLPLHLADRHDSTGSHFHNEIGKHGRVFSIVGDVYRGELQAALESREFLPQCRPKFGVKARQWLVQEQDLRLANDSTRQGDTLLLAAGQFVWVTIDELLNPDDL
jgi:hypothetical protein